MGRAPLCDIPLQKRSPRERFACEPEPGILEDASSLGSRLERFRIAQSARDCATDPLTPDWPAWHVGTTKRMAEVMALAHGVDLARERDALKAKMDEGWAWLKENPDDPRFTEFEDKWIGWLKDYEKIVDALAEEALRATAPVVGLPPLVVPEKKRRAKQELPPMTIGGKPIEPPPPEPDRDQAILERIWRWGDELGTARRDLPKLATRRAVLMAKLDDPRIGTPEQRAEATAKADEMRKEIDAGLREARDTIEKLVGQRSLLTEEAKAVLAAEWRWPEWVGANDAAFTRRAWEWFGVARLAESEEQVGE